MPIHDWTRVDGIFPTFHHAWIEEIQRALNRGILAGDYYALVEQFAGRINPDVLTLQGIGNGDAAEPPAPETSSNGGVLLAPPKLLPTAGTDRSFTRRKQSTVAIRHVSRDRIVAVVEVVSPGNKGSRNPLQAFVQKVAELLDKHVHVLILDLLPPGRRDPQGLHALIWEEVAGEEGYTAPAGKPLTLASYERALGVRAYVLHAGVGDELPEIPLFLEPQKAVSVPPEATYRAAYAAVPRRWQRVLEASPTRSQPTEERP
jgi:hypothetical protein